MNKRLQELMDAKIEAELNALDYFDPASEEHNITLDNAAKLYRIRVDEEKAEMENTEKQLRRQMEAEQYERDLECRNGELKLKEEQLSEQVKEHERDADLRERELQFEEIHMEQQRRVDYVKLGAEIAGIVLPLIFYGCWMAKGFKFEETGKFTSDTFRGLYMKFKPVKK